MGPVPKGNNPNKCEIVDYTHLSDLSENNYTSFGYKVELISFCLLMYSDLR